MTTTPWGAATLSKDLAPGITLISTASHGGVRLDPEQNAKVPARYRAFAAGWSHGFFNGNADEVGWYEHDVAIFAVVITFPDVFDDVDIPSVQVALDRQVGKGS